MKVYLEPGSKVIGDGLMMEVEQSQETLHLSFIPAGALLMYQDMRNNTSWQVTWDWDSPPNDPNYGKLYYDDDEQENT